MDLEWCGRQAVRVERRIMDVEGAIQELCAATGATVEVAKNLLEACQGDPERAAHLYFAEAAGEAEVRPPDAVKVDVLYADQPRTDVPRDAVDAFRGFKDDSRELAKLFAPPEAMLFRGGLDKAKQKACEQGRWLLVNVQSSTEFASHRLNRDLWTDELVQSTVMASFVFWQTYHNADEGAKACHFYKLEHLPVIMVIDPVTGQKLVQWTGYVSPEKLMENLLPFLDRGPLDGGPPPVSLKRTRSIEPPATKKQDHMQLGLSSEDAELAAAIAASLEASKPAQEASGEGPSTVPEAAEDAHEERESTELEDLLQAVRELQPEPDAGNPQSCRVAVRLPGGGRIQRRFLRDQRVRLLHVYCMQEVEEARRGRAFQLSPSMPASSPLQDMEATIAQSGVADSILNMKWTD